MNNDSKWEFVKSPTEEVSDILGAEVRDTRFGPMLLLPDGSLIRSDQIVGFTVGSQAVSAEGEEAAERVEWSLCMLIGEIMRPLVLRFHDTEAAARRDLREMAHRMGFKV